MYRSIHTNMTYYEELAPVIVETEKLHELHLQVADTGQLGHTPFKWERQELWSCRCMEGLGKATVTVSVSSN